jgi:hypothetical protein
MTNKGTKKIENGELKINTSEAQTTPSLVVICQTV